MRVIAGEFRSRRLKSLPGTQLFDILAPRIERATLLDAYAGTGAVGIEALSRGAREVVFVEVSRAAADVIRENLKSLGAEARAQVFCGKALVVLERIKTDLVFLDPPYDRESEYSAAMALLGAAPPALAIVQHTVRLKLREEYGRLRRTRTVRQGDNVLSFYAETQDAAAPLPY
jgi:16S rRNA (guanine966-N2)-methyltransferase